MSLNLGDRTEDSTIDFKWSSNDGAGASITRATNGTISVYKANGTTQTTTGVTDTEDFDSVTGVHHCRIETTDAFYAVGEDYQVVLSAATIDGQTVNAVLAHFTIEKVFNEVDVTKWLGQAVATPTVNGVPEVDVTHFGGTAATASGGRPEVNTTHAAGTAWGSGAITAASLAGDAITAAKVAADVGTEIGTAVWATTTRLLTAGTNIALAKGTGVTGFNDLDAAGVRAAVGLAAADLDTQLAALPTAVENADALLGRNVAGGGNGTRTVSEALKRLRNRVRNNAGTMEVYEANDTDISWQAALTTAAGNPISEVNPA